MFIESRDQWTREKSAHCNDVDRPDDTVLVKVLLVTYGKVESDLRCRGPIENPGWKTVMLSECQFVQKGLRGQLAVYRILNEIAQQWAFNITILRPKALEACLQVPSGYIQATINEIRTITIVPIQRDCV